jgi:DNA polymerase-3 subunit gamma/tau
LAYQVLARRWRPQRFGEVVGQEHVTRTLTNAIRAGRLAHAFLFCGPRGVGKTTTARIVAKCLNCETAADGPVPDPCDRCESCREIIRGVSLDVLEIDGASNRGIDEIRDLRENVRYAPTAGRAKVYIIDEVHMLTKEAFNALLKTLEEPPPSVYFVFATTESHKVPATIRSRCQRFDFHRVSTADIVETLKRLAAKEKIEVEPEAFPELARHADGGLRDAESLLDQAASIGDGKVTLAALRQLVGEAEDEVVLSIVGSIVAADAGEAFSRLSELLDRGLDPGRVALALTQALRDLLVVQSAPDKSASLGVGADLADTLRKLGTDVSGAKLTALLTLASRAVADLRRSARPRLALEVALARMCRLEDPGEMADLVHRVKALTADTGSRTPPTPPTPPRSAPSSTSSRPETSGGTDPEPAPSEVTASAVPATAGEGVSAIWTGLLGRVKERKVMLASFLGHGAPLSLEEGTFTAVFDNDYYEGMVSRRENLAIIHEELAILAGKATSFRAKMGVVPAGAASAASAPAEERAARRGQKDLLEENQGLRRIMHDLGGTLLPGGSA